MSRPCSLCPLLIHIPVHRVDPPSQRQQSWNRILLIQRPPPVRYRRDLQFVLNFDFIILHLEISKVLVPCWVGVAGALPPSWTAADPLTWASCGSSLGILVYFFLLFSLFFVSEPFLLEVFSHELTESLTQGWLSWGLSEVRTTRPPAGFIYLFIYLVKGRAYLHKRLERIDVLTYWAGCRAYGVLRITGLNLIHGAKFQRFLSGKSVFLNSNFQIREFHAQWMEWGEVLER